jgi:toxin ParE1/3/4
MQIKWRPLALDDIDRIVDYIGIENPAAAVTVVDAIHDQVDRLAQYPKLGRAGRIKGTRELVITGQSYIVPYREIEGVVEVLRVYHTSMLWPEDIVELNVPRTSKAEDDVLES